MFTVRNYQVELLSERGNLPLEMLLRENRHIINEHFFSPTLSDLPDPYLLPDMREAVDRIMRARSHGERIVIFGDYDVDGVSGTAILVRYLIEIGCIVSYRLPHRVHDGYGLQSYFFDELAEKNVKLVVTVDCGTRDIEPIQYAKSLGIDVIVTDHHAVPDILSSEVIGIVNPKRSESQYPFRDLSGSGVAFTLVHALAKTGTHDVTRVEKVLTEYSDFAALGTVSDCMPLVGVNRIIVFEGLRTLRYSRSSALRKYLAGREKVRSQDADIIGFQIGPRINAAGRMDSPLLALQWLLAGDDRADALFAELEYLNTARKSVTDTYFEQALREIDIDEPLLFYDSHHLEHGVIGLVAGKLAEMYGKPAIVLKNGDTHRLARRKGYTVEDTPHSFDPSVSVSVASCRSPEWCNIMELLESCKHLFIRYGGHAQAAGFTIPTEKIPELRIALRDAFSEHYNRTNLPKRKIRVDCTLDLERDCTLDGIKSIDRFRPFGIGNPKPLFLIHEATILRAEPLGSEGRHLQIRLQENPALRLVLWGWRENFLPFSPHCRFGVGDVVSFIVSLDENEWNGRKSVSIVIEDVVIPENTPETK